MTRNILNEVQKTIDDAKYAIASRKSESIQGVCREIEWDTNEETKL
ncbi:hypothetical protein FACS1894147_06130 [Spirochaetia bacterium]|nr:hypothetical protein FACS1894147_06130 [Spirochaetia bacterium]